MNKKSIEVKAALKKGTALTYLEDLIKSIKLGKIVIQQDDEFVSLSPAEAMELEVSASQKKGKEKLSFELSWLTDIATVSDSTLVISSKEPEPKPVEKSETPGTADTKATAAKATPAKSAAVHTATANKPAGK